MFNLNYFSMTRKIFNPAALAAIMALAACTNDEMQPSVNDSLTLGNAKNTVRISLSDAMGTRAARPIYSSEAANNINRIAFKVVDSENNELEQEFLKGVTDGDGGEIEGAGTTTDNIVYLPDDCPNNIKVEFLELPKGSYKIIAYGYNCDEETYEFPYNLNLASDGRYTYICDGIATEVQEIFAGSSDNGKTDLISVNQHGMFEDPITIELKRQVAGLLAYFKNAPAYVDNQQVKKITVSSKADVRGFYLPASLHDTGLGYNGYPLDNSWISTDWVNYLTFEVYNKAVNQAHLTNGDYYEFENILLAEESSSLDTGKIDYDPEDQEYKLFGSRFLVPFPKYCDFSTGGYDCATLNICYWGDNEKLIKSIPLKYGNNGSDKLDSSSTYQYGIKYNNFYSIGKIGYNDGEGEDEPIDIDEATGYDNLTVTIDSQWVINDDFHN